MKGLTDSRLILRGKRNWRSGCNQVLRKYSTH